MTESEPHADAAPEQAEADNTANADNAEPKPRKARKPVKPVKGKSARARRRAEDQRIMRNAAILRAMPDNIAEALAHARVQPIWCSDTRWRMELRRRGYRVW